MLTSIRSSGNTQVSRVIWSNEEWQTVAAELVKKVPNWRAHAFTMEEFEEAMEAVLGQGRQRTYLDFEEVQPQLFAAFDRLPQSTTRHAEPVKTTKTVREKTDSVSHPIRWTPDQWEQVVLELHRLYPDVFAEQLVKIGNKHADTAQKVLPKHLHRHFVQVVGFRASALKIWNDLPAEIRNPQLQIRPIVDFPSGPIMAPIAKKSDDSNAVASAMQKAFHAPEETEQKRKKHVQWSAREWLDIAREMHRQNPHANWFSNNFFVLDLPAIRAAQREAIVFERRRTLPHSGGLRVPLVEAFKALHVEMALNIDKELKAEIKAEQVQEAPQLVAEPAKEVTEVAPTAAPVAAITPVAAHLEANDFMAGLLNAALPLAQFFVGELAKQMAPALVQAMMPEFKKAFDPMMQSALESIKTAAAASVLHRLPGTTHQEVVTPVAAYIAPEPATAPLVAKQSTSAYFAPPEKVKKPSLAVIGPMGAQKAMIENSFPEFRFIFIEHGHGIKEAAANSELLICAMKFPPDSIKSAIKTHVDKDKVRYINNGSVSSIKRQINVWKADKVFA